MQCLHLNLEYKQTTHQFGPLLSICGSWRTVSGPARGGQGFLPVTHPEAVTPLLLGFHYVVTITTLPSPPHRTIHGKYVTRLLAVLKQFNFMNFAPFMETGLPLLECET